MVIAIDAFDMPVETHTISFLTETNFTVGNIVIKVGLPALALLTIGRDNYKEICALIYTEEVGLAWPVMLKISQCPALFSCPMHIHSTSISMENQSLLFYLFDPSRFKSDGSVICLNAIMKCSFS